MELLQSNLNKKIPTRTGKEYRDTNKTTIAEKNHKYYNTHTEAIIEQSKLYYFENLDNKLSYAKEYRKDNRQKISEKGKILFTCECGSTLRIRDTIRHNKCTRHVQFINDKV